MFKFNEERFLKVSNVYISERENIEKVVDQICEKGYKNLFLVGIGGTIAYMQQFECIIKSRSAIQIYVENAAEFTKLGNKQFCKDSVMVIVSASGDTKEVVEAVELAKSKGVVTIGIIGDGKSVLGKAVDHPITSSDYCNEVSSDPIYYCLYVLALRFMRNAGEFPQYEKFFEELKNAPVALLNVKKEVDKKAEEFVTKYKDEPIHYLVGAGNLWGATYSYAMCVMEECQWMRTKSIHAADFFHGTLEVIERGVNVVLFKGEDEARPLMERVDKFVNKVTDQVTVFDTKDYELKGFSEEFRGLLSPLVLNAMLERLSVYLEEKRKHPMEIRRYYKRLDY